VRVCNPTAEAKRVILHLGGVTLTDRRPTMQVVRAASLDAWGYDYVASTTEARVDAVLGLTVDCPPCSLVAGEVR